MGVKRGLPRAPADGPGPLRTRRQTAVRRRCRLAQRRRLRGCAGLRGGSCGPATAPPPIRRTDPPVAAWLLHPRLALGARGSSRYLHRRGVGAKDRHRAAAQHAPRPDRWGSPRRSPAGIYLRAESSGAEGPNVPDGPRSVRARSRPSCSSRRRRTARRDRIGRARARFGPRRWVQRLRASPIGQWYQGRPARRESVLGPYRDPGRTTSPPSFPARTLVGAFALGTCSGASHDDL